VRTFHLDFRVYFHFPTSLYIYDRYIRVDISVLRYIRSRADVVESTYCDRDTTIYCSSKSQYIELKSISPTPDIWREFLDFSASICIVVYVRDVSCKAAKKSHIYRACIDSERLCTCIGICISDTSRVKVSGSNVYILAYAPRQYIPAYMRYVPTSGRVYTVVNFLSVVYVSIWVDTLSSVLPDTLHTVI
jgi:hypothetical protein